MSAIAGLFRPEHHSVEVAQLQQMIEILSHRGPDGTNLWCDGPIGLGHCLLQTTPESLLEECPLTNASQTLTLTADARIDNRADLIQTLSLQALPPETITDSALILAAYEHWGEECPQHLIGDFAFVIWDAAQHSLFCARDPLGVKPFFYYGSDTVFAFASEIKALFCTPDVPRELNETRVADFLTMMLFDPTMTVYRQILRLPAAHSMTVRNQTIQISCYWSLDPDYELQLESDQAYADRFREIFTEAVRCRLRSAFPVGTMLSGGIDSSAITCTAVQLKKQGQDQTKLPTFSAVFNEITASDEQDYINAVIDEGGIDPFYVQGDQIGPWTDYQQVLAEQDEPLFACNLHLTRALYKTAQQKSVRVLLDGFDGDQTVSHGVGHLKTLARAGRWLKLFQEMQRFCRNYDHAFLPLYRSYLYKFGLEPILKQTKIIKLTHKLTKLKSSLLPTPTAPPSEQAMPWQIPLNSEFVDQLDILKRYQQLRRQRFGAQPTQRHGHIADITSGLISSTLEVMDRTAAACQLELRYPFWDKRLVEFCVSLPEEQKMQHGWTRLIIRRAMAGILPPLIQWRCSKGNLGTAFDHTLCKYESPLIREALFNPPNKIPDFIDIVAMRKTFAQFADGQISNSDNTMLIWQAVNLSLWLKQTEIDQSFSRTFTKD